MAKKGTKRSQLPASLPGATSFSDDRAELDPVAVIRLLKQQKRLCDRLVQVTTIRAQGVGRQRGQGSWALAYIAFVASRKYADIEPWWTVAAANPQLWRECGFKGGRPPYSTVYERFTELEQFAWEFQTTVGELVQQARRASGGLVGRDVHVDSCEEETHARLVHDCQPGEQCRREAELLKRKRQRTSAGRQAPISPPLYPDRDTCKHAGEERGKLASEPPLEAEPKVAGLAEQIRTEKRGRAEVQRLRINGCWYRSLDTEAGIRCYGGKQKRSFKFWHGYYNTKAIDHYTAAPLSIVISSASTQECHIYPVLLDRVLSTVGGTVRSVVADKGFSVESVYQENTSRGIFTVMPFRRGSHKTRPEYATSEYDAHGVPRCKHCGEEGVFVSFTLKPKPRLLYRCSINCPASAGKRQSINCERKWRFLLPLWRTTELYHALRASHGSYERVHGFFRRRYHVGGDSCDTRAKRLGRGARQLRANAALVIEWLLINWRQGWSGGRPRNERPVWVQRGARELARLLRYRARLASQQLQLATTNGAHGPAPP